MFNTERVIKVFEENGEEKIEFLKNYNNSPKDLYSKKFIRYVFKNLDNKIEHLISLKTTELQRYECVIEDCLNNGQIEIVEYFRQNLNNVNINYIVTNLRFLEVIIYLEKIDKLVFIDEQYYDFVIENNLVDIMIYLSKKSITKGKKFFIEFYQLRDAIY